MAMQLSDVVLRRLVEGQTGELTSAQIEIIAAYMAKKYAWSEDDLKRQKTDLAVLMALPSTKKAATKTKGGTKSKGKTKPKEKPKAKPKPKSTSK
jgi:hypothetical protein